MKKSDGGYPESTFVKHLIPTFFSTLMPHPPLHITADEKREATKRKHAKYYQRHKSEIQYKRAEKRICKQQGTRMGSRHGKQELGRQGESLNTPGTSKLNNPLQRVELVLPEQPWVLAARKWEGKAQKVQEKICKIYGKHDMHHGYCDDLYRRYLAEYKETSDGEMAYHKPFDSAHTAMEGYTRLFTKYKLKLLEEVIFWDSRR
ncbi:hypothetical protein PM082_022125 [Marasmius tenuissimus]|nr:hypothetical protein PM082_022125 [Marasmius tenuissimus]